MSLTVSIRNVGAVTVVDIIGRIVLGEESASLRTLVVDLLSKGNNKILFNLAHVDYIDTTGLGLLISSLLKVRMQKGELKLTNLSGKLQDVMQITKLYTVFEIFEDEAAALRSFDQSSTAKA